MKQLLKIFFGNFRFVGSIGFIERLIVAYFIVCTVCMIISAACDSTPFIIISGINTMISLILLNGLKTDLIDE